ncbi:tRNA pseudouridine synthase A [Desulfamplus magnetovallimortis]|uniref:tRNA pseudouridine synthase A n=1 Tax=Desulfamplus magnetovallimortis TaxID=1246637 RepID=A0A1W1HDP1_9BACT|nr:tRNA pseudouridine synthase A [Desulfamplus magnetovallimortis]
MQSDRSTVQGELEKVLSLILNQPVNIIGSGRTDAGVHAIGQVANIKADTRISSNTLQKAVNSLIKTPIVVRNCEEVPMDFHARYNAQFKEYHYHIFNCELPKAIGRNYEWHIRRPLNIAIMNQCCKMLLGEHDFKSFEGAGSPRAHTVRTIFHASVEEVSISSTQAANFHLSGTEHKRGRFIIIKLKGNGFLRFMVRNITGTLVMAGLDQISPHTFKEILQAKDRNVAGATAPPHGLCLVKVDY